MLTLSVDDCWQRAVASGAAARGKSIAAAPSTIYSAVQLQSELTRSLEATRWFELFNASARYQQTILTALTLSPATSAWLSTPPLTSEPAYRLRDEEYVLAVRHRLGLLPYDDLREEQCVACANRDLETPALLVDPDHAHSCVLQQGASVRRRHDAVKLALAELARSCGYHVEIEPHFPQPVEYRLNSSTGSMERCTVEQPDIRGDLLLLRNGRRLLLDVTVVRPTSLKWLKHGATRAHETSGAHMQPLVAAADAEAHKLHTYSAACQRAGWTMVPFALESYGGKGKQAARLLQQMAAHALDKSPEAFLLHAERVLSVALQVGNAGVASQGTAELHLQTARRSRRTDELASTMSGSAAGRSPRKQQQPQQQQQHQRRAAMTPAQLELAAARAPLPLLCMRGNGPLDLSSLLHGEYHSARIGVRQVMQQQRQLRSATPAA